MRWRPGWQARTRPCAACWPDTRTRRRRTAADLLWLAIGELDFSGRVLAAANAALPVPDGSSLNSGLARLWQAATLLRERRGDGHFAALAAADIDGAERWWRCGAADLRREDRSRSRLDR